LQATSTIAAKGFDFKQTTKLVKLEDSALAVDGEIRVFAIVQYSSVKKRFDRSSNFVGFAFALLYVS
jgi:hypothetical protein